MFNAKLIAKLIADEIESCINNNPIIDGDDNLILSASKAEWEFIIDVLRNYKENRK